jgi:hypothetical protein
MTSRSQIASNRRNAYYSTGPATQAGKQAVAGNARRHGLTGKLAEGSDAFHQAEQLTQAVWARASCHPEALAPARAYAHAQVKLDLIRQRRRAGLEQMLPPTRNAPVHATGEQTAMPTPSLDLEKLARYERMARAERLQALETLAGYVRPVSTAE